MTFLPGPPFTTVKAVYPLEKPRNFLGLDIWSRQD